MGAFENIVLNMKSAIDNMGKKTGDFVDLSKLRLNESEIKNSITKMFGLLGKLYYESNKEKNDNQEKINNCIEKIDKLYEELKKVQCQISSLKNVIKCCNCGRENDPSMNYCGFCGNKLIKEKETIFDLDVEDKNDDQDQAKKEDEELMKDLEDIDVDVTE